MAGDVEPAAEIVPERHAVPGAGLGKAQEGIAAISTQVAACPGADLAACDLAADIVLRTIGVQRDFGPLQHHQQLCLVGVQARQKAIQGGKAGAAAEDAVEPCPQRETTAFVRIGLVRLEISVEVPDQFPHLLLGGAMRLREGVQFVHQPFGMDPAQCVLADLELPGIIAQHHGIAQEVVRVDAAPDRCLGGDLHRIRRRGQSGEFKPVKLCRPGGLIGKDPLRLRRQTGNERGG